MKKRNRSDLENESHKKRFTSVSCTLSSRNIKMTNNIDLLVTMQCSAGKSVVPAFMWMPLYTPLQTRYTPSCHLHCPVAVVHPATLKKLRKGPKNKTKISRPRPDIQFPRSQSHLASMGHAVTSPMEAPLCSPQDSKDETPVVPETTGHQHPCHSQI